MAPIQISQQEIQQQDPGTNWGQLNDQEKRWLVGKILRARGGSTYQIRMLELGNPNANVFVVSN